MTAQKKVLGTYGPGSNHWVGDGFPVRNMFPSNGLEAEVNPFLMLDYAGPNLFKPSGKTPGVGQHPHRGFETVTIAYQGSVEHRALLAIYQDRAAQFAVELTRYLRA